LDAGVKIARAERLGDVLVRPRCEAELDVLLPGARGQQDDRHRLRGLGVSQQAGHLEACELGHGDVEDRGVGNARPDQSERLLPVAGENDLEAGATEAQGDQREDVLVVVRHEHDSGRPRGRSCRRRASEVAQSVHVLNFGRHETRQEGRRRPRFDVFEYPLPVARRGFIWPFP
jgi:hypothetical protein